jgi:hypothetical protein
VFGSGSNSVCDQAVAIPGWQKRIKLSSESPCASGLADWENLVLQPFLDKIVDPSTERVRADLRWQHFFYSREPLGLVLAFGAQSGDRDLSFTSQVPCLAEIRFRSLKDILAAAHITAGTNSVRGTSGARRVNEYSSGPTPRGRSPREPRVRLFAPRSGRAWLRVDRAICVARLQSAAWR